MDKRHNLVLEEFIERLSQTYPEVTIQVNDYKWSTEDISLEVVIPNGLTEEEESDFLDKQTEIAGDLSRETDVYILALARSPEIAEV